jgi:hypothetical protein
MPDKPTKRQEQAVIEIGKPYIDRDNLTIAAIITEELKLSADDLPEDQVTAIINITNKCYALGMLAGVNIGEETVRLLHRTITMN